MVCLDGSFAEPVMFVKAKRGPVSVQAIEDRVALCLAKRDFMTYCVTTTVSHFACSAS